MKTAPKPEQPIVNRPEPDSREKTLLLARLGLSKKAREVVLLHVGPLTTIAEFFIICSGVSVRHTRSIAQYVQTEAKGHGLLPLGVEGEEEGTWILLDYDDVVIHVFHEPTREVYTLERLWSDAPRLLDPDIEKEQASVMAEQEDVSWEP